MTSKTNLLPPERVRSLRQIYFLRLAVVTVALLTGLVGIHSVLLLPSYLYADSQARDREAELMLRSAALEGSEEEEIGARVSRLSEDASYLVGLGAVPKASSAISAVLTLPRDGIRLVGFSFAPKEEGAVMTVSGLASTRESLRRYEQALASQPYVTSASLPISAYAKERDIDFTVTLTGPFLP